MKSIPNKSSRHAVERRGQSLVEFALVVPVLVLMTVGVFDLGRAIYYYNVISGTARETARQAIVCAGDNVTPKDCTSQDTAAADGAQAKAVVVPISAITVSPHSRLYGDTVTVIVTANFVPATPLFGNISLTAESQMIAE
jgi:Flp pilus assembly protein TadG